jgi:hypothetical protein
MGVKKENFCLIVKNKILQHNGKVSKVELLCLELIEKIQ